MKFVALTPLYNTVFSIEELAHRFQESLAVIKTQLFRFCTSHRLVRLKRNRYTFPDRHPGAFLIAQNLVFPSYISLELMLSRAGIIPENVTMFTSVTSKKTQRYTTPFGTFDYRHLPPHLFFGIEKRVDGAWVAAKEKALLDYLYLNSKWFKPDFACWQGARFDELDTLDWKKIREWVPRFKMKKLMKLVESLEAYSKSDVYQAHR